MIFLMKCSIFTTENNLCILLGQVFVMFVVDPFVKVYLLQNGKKVSKKKTTVKRCEKTPIFNEAMIFSVPSTVLSVCEILLS